MVVGRIKLVDYKIEVSNMICSNCGIHRELGKMRVLDDLHYCKHCYSVKTRGVSVITDN